MKVRRAYQMIEVTDRTSIYLRRSERKADMFCTKIEDEWALAAPFPLPLLPLPRRQKMLMSSYKRNAISGMQGL